MGTRGTSSSFRVLQMCFSRNSSLVLWTFRKVILMVMLRSHGHVLFLLNFQIIKFLCWLINFSRCVFYVFGFLLVCLILIFGNSFVAFFRLYHLESGFNLSVYLLSFCFSLCRSRCQLHLLHLITMINRKIVTVTKCFVIVKLILCKEQKRLRGTARAAALHYQIQSQSICFLHGIVYFRTFLIMPEFLWEIQSSDGTGYR